MYTTDMPFPQYCIEDFSYETVCFVLDKHYNFDFDIYLTTLLIQDHFGVLIVTRLGKVFKSAQKSNALPFY